MRADTPASPAGEPGAAITYLTTRADYAAMIAAVQRRPLGQRLAVSGLILLILLGVAWHGAGGSLDRLQLFGARVAAGRVSWWFYPAVIVPVLLPLAVHRVLALLISPWFRRSVLAREPVRMELREDGISLSITGLSSHVAWSAVTRLIETPQHLFAVITTRQVVILPRRAFASEAAYQAARALVLRSVRPEVARRPG